MYVCMCVYVYVCMSCHVMYYRDFLASQSIASDRCLLFFAQAPSFVLSDSGFGV